jgi:hypothetical protein
MVKIDTPSSGGGSAFDAGDLFDALRDATTERASGVLTTALQERGTEAESPRLGSALSGEECQGKKPVSLIKLEEPGLLRCGCIGVARVRFCLEMMDDCRTVEHSKKKAKVGPGWYIRSSDQDKDGAMMTPFLPIEQGPISGPVELRFPNEREVPKFLPGAWKCVIQEWREMRGAASEEDLGEFFGGWVWARSLLTSHWFLDPWKSIPSFCRKSLWKKYPAG